MENTPQSDWSATLEVEQHVRRLNDDWVKAVIRADGPTLASIMADDFYFIYPLEGDDKDQFISDLIDGNLKIKHIAREQVSVRIFGAAAVLTARDSATWLYHGREMSGQYKIVSVFCERNGRWQLCAIQACPLQQ